MNEVIEDFERYWCSPSVYPAGQILPKVGTRQLERLESRSSVVENDPSTRRYVDRLCSLSLIHQVLDGTLPMDRTPIRLLIDDPARCWTALPTVICSRPG